VPTTKSTDAIVELLNVTQPPASTVTDLGASSAPDDALNS
jgi:predicted XRE-type DNA-binding protein